MFATKGAPSRADALEKKVPEAELVIRISDTDNPVAVLEVSPTPGIAGNIVTLSGASSFDVGGSGIDLAIASIVDAPDPVNDRPSQLTYTVVAVNNGASPANGVVVRIDLPDSGTSGQVAAGSNGFNCDPPVAGNIDCTGAPTVGHD